jgi:hypothetical protein
VHVASHPASLTVQNPRKKKKKKMAQVIWSSLFRFISIRPTNIGFIKRGLFTNCLQKGRPLIKTVKVMDMKLLAFY